MSGARVLICLVLVAGCGQCKHEDATDERGVSPAPRRREVPSPSRVAVRALPPHEIHVDGVGPYRLGEPLRTVLGRLPHGPRVELVNLEGIADYSLVRAEDDTIVVGVTNPSGVRFVSVIAPTIAHTEAGVGVGSTTSDLREHHGDAVVSRMWISDPRIYRPQTLPGIRFLIGRGRVDAVVVGEDPVLSGRGSQSSCIRTADENLVADVRRVSGLGSNARVAFGCREGESMAVVVSGSRIVVVGGPPENHRRLAVANHAGLVYAAPLDINGDATDEVVAVFDASADAERSVSIAFGQLGGSRLVIGQRDTVYRLDETAGRWLGVGPSEMELLVEVAAGEGVATVHGLLVHRHQGRVEQAIALEPVSVLLGARRSRAGRGGTPASAKPTTATEE